MSGLFIPSALFQLATCIVGDDMRKAPLPMLALPGALSPLLQLNTTLILAFHIPVLQVSTAAII